MKQLYQPSKIYEVQVNGVTGEWTPVPSQAASAVMDSLESTGAIKVYAMHRGTGTKELLGHSQKANAQTSKQVMRWVKSNPIQQYVR